MDIVALIMYTITALVMHGLAMGVGLDEAEFH